MEKEQRIQKGHKNIKRHQEKDEEMEMKVAQGTKKKNFSDNLMGCLKVMRKKGGRIMKRWL